MGAFGSTSKSESYIKQLDAITSSVLNTATNDCAKGFLTSAQVLEASGKCTIKIKDLSLTQLRRVSTECVQNVATSTQIKNDLESKLVQAANAQLATLSAFSTAEAESFIELHRNLATQVTNAFTQTCGVPSQQTQAIICRDEASIEGDIWNWTQREEIVSTCVQNVKAVVDVKDAIKDAIDQKSTAGKDKGKGVLVIFIVLGAILGIAILFLILRSVFRGSSGGGGSAPVVVLAGGGGGGSNARAPMTTPPPQPPPTRQPLPVV